MWNTRLLLSHFKVFQNASFICKILHFKSSQAIENPGRRWNRENSQSFCRTSSEKTSLKVWKTKALSIIEKFYLKSLAHWKLSTVEKMWGLNQWILHELQVYVLIFRDLDTQEMTSDNEESQSRKTSSWATAVPKFTYRCTTDQGLWKILSGKH